MIAGFIFFSGTLISSGELQVNQFFSFLAAMMLAYQPIRSLATINMVVFSGAAGAREYDVIDQPIKIQNDKSLPDLRVTNGDIKFVNVSFKYENSNDKAINDIDLSIEGGVWLLLSGTVELEKVLLLTCYQDFTTLRKVKSL